MHTSVFKTLAMFNMNKLHCNTMQTLYRHKCHHAKLRHTHISPFGCHTRRELCVVELTRAVEMRHDSCSFCHEGFHFYVLISDPPLMHYHYHALAHSYQIIRVSVIQLKMFPWADAPLVKCYVIYEHSGPLFRTNTLCFLLGQFMSCLGTLSVHLNVWRAATKQKGADIWIFEGKHSFSHKSAPFWGIMWLE